MLSCSVVDTNKKEQSDFLNNLLVSSLKRSVCELGSLET